MPTRPQILTALTSLALVLTPLTAAAADDGEQRLGPERAPVARAAQQAPGAEQALERAKGLFEVAPAHRRGTAAAEHGRDATMILRDLALHLDELSPNQQREAQQLLARPTDGVMPDGTGNGYQVKPEQPRCSVNFCFHWVKTTEDAPDLTDDDGNGTPDWVEDEVTSVFENVWRKTVGQMGYRAPKDDTTSPENGGDGKLDVYLADLGGLARPLYGYCATDDPAWPNRRDVSAYCVVDDDFAADQFGGVAPLKSMQVTAAHEFFHAVQSAYDFGEDLWLMEGTATWIEDEIYDGINDNRRYLATSPLRQPGAPLDYIGSPQTGDASFVYGSWIFWRFLSEYFGPGAKSDPAVIRQVWRRADARPGAPDTYSLRAVSQVTSARGVGFGKVFAEFGMVNRIAKRWYQEGTAYPQAPAAGTLTLTRANPATGRYFVDLFQLSNVHVKFRPGRTLTGTWRVRMSLNLPGTARGSRAGVMVHRKDGSIRRLAVRLNRDGDGSVVAPFSRGSIAYVALTLTNASSRYACWKRTNLSCQGIPRDDELRYSFSAKAIR